MLVALKFAGQCLKVRLVEVSKDNVRLLHPSLQALIEPAGWQSSKGL